MELFWVASQVYYLFNLVSLARHSSKTVQYFADLSLAS